MKDQDQSRKLLFQDSRLEWGGESKYTCLCNFQAFLKLRESSRYSTFLPPSFIFKLERGRLKCVRLSLSARHSDFKAPSRYRGKIIWHPSAFVQLQAGEGNQKYIVSMPIGHSDWVPSKCRTKAEQHFLQPLQAWSWRGKLRNCLWSMLCFRNAAEVQGSPWKPACPPKICGYLPKRHRWGKWNSELVLALKKREKNHVPHCQKYI